MSNTVCLRVVLFNTSWLYEWDGRCLMRGRNWLPFVSIWVRSWSFSVVRIAHLFFCVLFLSVCLFFDFLGFIFAFIWGWGEGLRPELCAQCSQCLCNVHSWLLFRFSLTFKNNPWCMISSWYVTFFIVSRKYSAMWQSQIYFALAKH